MGRSLVSWLIRLLIATFTVVFIYPAIAFACLVIGFTPSWRSGLLMLGSALLLRVILKWETRKMRPIRRSAGEQQLSIFPGMYEDEASPPPLSDIYYDIASDMREQERIMNIVNKRNTDICPPGSGHPANCKCQSCSRVASQK
ncbi:hypothetical protein [Paenibacillus sp. OV219]|uniref:hypothetical protein n=1 Tax=Paenibacillus sp. OV219 TaxID=1884377 RepID=UPI0008BA50C1|nr:hypothetical protein [Paenibacillus sp. OV219]SEO52013.1 hypothetical protein SAMN05518847_108148 [Paenibacillus sp. OV219]